ncbi:sensor histidine kinase [Erythrobacter sp. EC-HK427]|uniref:sensor histidine kinase n=1 Tax=Erythrobacter sp. EC-HK427 TaxID=2038396 RepID=UPI00125F0B10|nr:ATP-binding protein [Erythrobacter sp. EC-HK427]
MTERFFPIAGIVIALLTGGALVYSGVGWLFAVVIVALWIASFWISAPPPPVFRPPEPEGLTLTTSGMRDLVEHSGLPVLLLDQNRIIVANAQAREEIGRHVLGQDARVALRHPAAIDLLSREGGGSVTVQGLTGPKSNWQMTCQRIDARYSLVELINRTSEADVSRAHSDFVANASHELRTPLASIIGYMETLDETGPDLPAEKTAKFYQTVLKEARRLQSLIDDLMSLSKLEAEKHDQPRDVINFVPLIQQAARDGAGPERADRLEFKLEESALNVRGAQSQLEQLIRNLVDNALKYSAPGSKVTVSLALGDRDMAIVQITDRGEGIAREHLPHLTRRFYRTDPGRSRAAGGTGLGLAIVKHIVERHRGRLDIQSTLGEGTTVSVRLPVASQR